MMKRKLVLPGIGVAVLVCALFFIFLKKEGKKVEWRTAAVQQGDIVVEVTATGTLNPHKIVAVGTQVSGTVAKLFVDFNSQVRTGQVVAMLDTTFLHAAVEDAAANLAKSDAQEKLAQEKLNRTRSLFEKGLSAKADLDQAVADHAVAKANLVSSRAQLDRAKINLRYATITSPIDGIVIGRHVDVGQTVAASFNTPTLFDIADDLRRMQVQAGIDEADIGGIKLNQKARFTVDAFPSRKFEGVVSQIRLQPVTTQNVVNYTVMIDVENPGQMLLPGMTANITIVTQEAFNVLKVPGAALTFRPPQTNGSDEDGRTLRRNRRQGAGVQAGTLQDSAQGSIIRTDSTRRRHFSADSLKQRERVFVLENGALRYVPVISGLSSNGFVAVEGELQPGALVVLGIKSDAAQKSTARNPFGGGRGRF